MRSRSEIVECKRDRTVPEEDARSHCWGAWGRMPVGNSAVFFFQPEDGIRYYKVTGVHTCALPIYVEIGGRKLRPPIQPRIWDTQHSSTFNHPPRSEERRVGKGVDLGGRRIIK